VYEKKEKNMLFNCTLAQKRKKALFKTAKLWYTMCYEEIAHRKAYHEKTFEIFEALY
jgi:hypothetical protein